MTTPTLGYSLISLMRLFESISLILSREWGVIGLLILDKLTIFASGLISIDFFFMRDYLTSLEGQVFIGCDELQTTGRFSRIDGGDCATLLAGAALSENIGV